MKRKHPLKTYLLFAPFMGFALAILLPILLASLGLSAPFLTAVATTLYVLSILCLIYFAARIPKTKYPNSIREKGEKMLLIPSLASTVMLVVLSCIFLLAGAEANIIAYVVLGTLALSAFTIIPGFVYGFWLICKSKRAIHK